MTRHPGRWQAQGANVEESEAWTRNDPLPASDGRSLLGSLQAKLTRTEATSRQGCFEAARLFIDRAESAGGIDHPYVRSFMAPGDRFGRRIDLEVHLGKAFVP